MDIAMAKDRLASVVKPDSITASQGDFLATHVAIKKLVMLNKFEFVPTSEKYTSEEDIYKKFIVNPSNKHQFIVVYGQSGTGKSHLIRWFEARYKADRPDCKLRSNGMPVPLLRNCYSIFNGTKYR